MAWVGIDNVYLKLSQMQNNAAIIRDYFRDPSRNWTLNAIAGMLGNMQTESTLNPRLWQGRSIPADWETAEKGFGLTQWDPGRKCIKWILDTYGDEADYHDGYLQCARIQYERENNLQWSLDNLGQHTWDDYVNSTESPERLARVFVWAYERPEDPDVPQRQAQARYWYNYLSLIIPGTNLPIYMFNAGKRRGILARRTVQL